ncbi:MAG TPA: sugar transferase [Parafilimonas sp.]|nr:sugar transferase [Parafilimonas sp.]
MNTVLNPKFKDPQDILQPKSHLIKQKLKLLLVLSATTAEKEQTLFPEFDAVVVSDINEAKQIIHLHNDDFVDTIICDSEIGRRDILDFIGFLNSRKLSTRVPLLSFVFRGQPGHKIKSNHIAGIDDVISSHISADELAEKIEILKKYKFFKDKMPYHIESAKSERPDYQYISKRILDIILSSLLIILLSPIIILIAILIKLESKGPIFYKSLRAGKWYRVFTFFKFRTMVVNADNMVAELQYMNEYKDYQTSFFFKLKDDPRVTRVGKILRKTSLDELPQLINVLKGDMSLVGNRPLPLYEAQTITIDKSAKRFFAPAGITGLWQVKGRSNDNLTVQERINMDIDYADNSSFLYDLKILLKTPKELIQKNNV